MYGLVLMTALAAGGDAPAYHDGVGCSGGGCYASYSCGGCYSTYTGGCTATSCSGCYASSCNGCRSSIFPLFPGLRARAAGFLGMRSGCCGGSCYSSSCYGSSSCMGSSCYGGAVYYGTSSYAPYTGCTGHAPSYGCTGGGCTGSIIVGSAGESVPHVSIPSVNPEHQASVRSLAAAPARLTIELPATAKLYVDGNLIKGEGISRNFHTPELPRDQTFFYEFKAEVMVDGKPVTETKKVLVRSGDVLTESFPKLLAAAKSDASTLASSSR